METKIFRIPILLLACAAVNVTNAIEPDASIQTPASPG
jgi:hypothetical protein